MASFSVSLPRYTFHALCIATLHRPVIKTVRGNLLGFRFLSKKDPPCDPHSFLYSEKGLINSEATTYDATGPTAISEAKHVPFD